MTMCVDLVVRGAFEHFRGEGKMSKSPALLQNIARLVSGTRSLQP